MHATALIPTAAPPAPAAPRATVGHRARLGFVDGERGAHSHATLMVRDLHTLFDALPAEAGPADYARLVVDENVLGKRTSAARRHTLRNLVHLYAFDPELPLFRIVRALWDQEPEGRPRLALLCALARDPLLRASVEAVLDAPPGQPLASSTLAATVTRPLTPGTKKAIGTRLLSTWAQAGYLDSPRRRLRVRAPASPAAVAGALALGFMEGGRGGLLLSSPWVRLLELSAGEALDLARVAARRGWIELRTAGDIIDLRVDPLFLPHEKEWCDGQ